MTINDVVIDDTFAEAFGIVACRVVVTAASERWVKTAAAVTTGFATSVIGCDVEAGVETWLRPDQTPDGRPGVALLFFAFNREGLQKAVVARVGQCIMTCPSTACYNGLPITDKNIDVGGQLRFFGDGHQISKLLDGRRYWRIPVMDGEFVCEETFGTIKGVAGGNFLILAASAEEGLLAAEHATSAIANLSDVILPFPGGVVRAGSKVGSKYKKLKASTNDAYCPTLRTQVSSKLPAQARAAYEIVLDGLTLDAVRAGMAAGIRAACRPGVITITAGNYGGSLGPFHIHLLELLAESST